MHDPALEIASIAYLHRMRGWLLALNKRSLLLRKLQPRLICALTLLDEGAPPAKTAGLETEDCKHRYRLAVKICVC
jgi:hypothetical protein